MKNIAICCGGASYEHEVSIITGIQVAEAIDKSKYQVSFLYFNKDNKPYVVKNFKTRKDFRRQKHVPVDIVQRDAGAALLQPSRFNKTIAIDVFYLAFHGGTGEAGGVQGMLETLGATFTGPSAEAAAVVMNKSLTKEVLHAHGVSVLPSLTVFPHQYTANKERVLKTITSTFTYPVILKPVHLGSSIAIEIAHNDTELEKFLSVALQVDKEVLVEPALQDFTEFNVSVRSDGFELQCSPIEEPVREGETLSFDDKYTNGSKKTGTKQGGGMELLDRTVPAKISPQLRDEIIALAEKVYRACRLSGLVRIDFMYSAEKLYCTEINPIPGSMSFYLWEAAGEQFQEQITQVIDDACNRFAQQIVIEPYETDIVEKFVA